MLSSSRGVGGHVPRMRTLAATAVAVLSVCSAAGAAAPSWESFVDQQYGIRVSIPKAWCIVPPSAAQIEAVILRIKNQKNVPSALARTYLSYLVSAQADPTKYIFQAFECPLTPWPDPTDFAIEVARTSTPYSASALLRSAFAKGLAAQGMTVTRSAVVTLRGGQALLVTADWHVTTQISARVEEYIVPHGTLLFLLSLRTDARDPGALPTFAEIADRFAFLHA